MTLHRQICTLLFALFSAAALAETVTGTVTNRTTNKPVAGDDVVLLDGAEMKEVQRVKTDAQGHFTVTVAGDGFHLLRITHDKANYFSPLRANSGPVAVDVYSGADKVDGIKLNADVMYIQTDPTGTILSVNELLIEKNESSPPQTLTADRSVTFYLPAGATVEGASAKAPGGLAVQVAVKPAEEPNQYAVTFPLRPGETQITVTYRLKYTGSMDFKPRPMVPTDNMVVLMPKAMSFKPDPGTTYAFDNEDPRIQVFVAKNVEPSQPVGFAVSGSGQLPHDNAPPSGGAQNGSGSGAPANDGSDSNQVKSPGVGLANPLDNAAEREGFVSKYKWFLIGGIGLLFVAGAAVLLSSGGPSSSKTAGTVDTAQPGAVLEVLRHEMFAVETDRLEGKLTEEQYQELKAAFDVVLRRALARNSQTSRAV